MRFKNFFPLCLLLNVPLAAAAQGLTPGQFAGCYDIKLGPWNHPQFERFDSLRYQPPPRIELDTMPILPESTATGPFRVGPAPGSRTSRHRFSGWEIEGDSIRVTWTTGFVGLSVIMAPDHGTLRGYALTISDVEGDARYRAEVVATGVSCSAAPEFPFSDGQWVLRSVELGTGASLVLGKPLPDRSHVSGKSSEFGYVFMGPARGPFEGASLVKARAPEHERISQIRMEFSGMGDPEPLIERLESEMGRPGTRSEFEGLNLVHWEDTTTTLSVSWTGDQVTVILSDPRLR